MTTKNEPIFRPILLALILAIGVASAWAMLVSWGYAIVERPIGRNRLYESILILRDGTPVIESYRGSDYGSREFRNLDGSPSPSPGSGRDIIVSSPDGSLAGPKEMREPLDGISWRHRLVSFSDNRRLATHWYFMHDGQTDGCGYFVGYEKRSKLLVGYIGLDGFQKKRPSRDGCFRVDARKMFLGAAIANSQCQYGCEPYSGGYLGDRGDESSFLWHLAWVVGLLTDEGIVKIDLRSFQVENVYPSSELVSIGLALGRDEIPEQVKAQLNDESREPRFRGNRFFLVARTPDRVLLFDSDGGEPISYPIPAEVADSRFNNCYLPTGSTLLLHVTEYTGRGTTNERLLWVDRQGKVVRREELSLVVGGTQGPTVFLFTLGFLSPSILGGGGLGVILWAHLESPERNFNALMALALREYWQALLISCLVSMAAAYVCFRRQRRYALRGTWAWVAMVFLFGIPGLLGYLFCRRWPVLEACGACHAPAPRDRPSCSACDAPFPEPAPKGIEVFA